MAQFQMEYYLFLCLPERTQKSASFGVFIETLAQSVGELWP